MKQENISIVQNNTETFKIKVDLPGRYSDLSKCSAELYIFDSNKVLKKISKSAAGQITKEEVTIELPSGDNSFDPGVMLYEIWLYYDKDQPNEERKTILQGKLTVVESMFKG